LRISHRRNNYKFEAPKNHRVNEAIKVPQVRLIDEMGENYGVVETYKALAMAQDRGLDLVEVSPLAQPPVAKIVNFSKMKYQEEKERRKERAKQKKVEVKGIRLSLRISDHDKEVRIKRAQNFLNDGDKVKLEMLLRGREQQHKDLAADIIKKFVETVNESVPITTEQSLTIMGGRLSIIIVKKIINK